MSIEVLRKPGIIEFYLGFGLAFQVMQYHEEYTLCLSLVFIKLYISLPNFGYDYENWDRSWGFYYHAHSFWFQWGNKSKSIRMPWDWEHISRTVKYADGFKKPIGEPWDLTDGRIVEEYPYTYKLKNGDIQHRSAKIYEEKREWRWNWLRFLPWPCIKQHSINVEFDGEIGERTGSWKGGTLGCGYNIKKNETAYDCLNRMEKERIFN